VFDLMTGKSYILQDRAQALAKYPHARRVKDTLYSVVTIRYISGISSRKADNTWDGVTDNADGSFNSDISIQTKAVIENIKVILAAAGGDLSDLVDMTVFLVNMEHYAEFNVVYNQYFDAENGPSRTTVAVKELPNPRLLIEIKAIAAFES
jgi:2-aminomuconate deaminase